MAQFWALIQAIPALTKLFTRLFDSYQEHVLKVRREAREEQSKGEDVVLEKLKETHQDEDLADLAESLNKLRSPK